ncbi:hypothetical protein FA95DRAFT_1556986 [Auriscalpium vulgare]|uniref:Uncharacterized protein n=1 Tax=Auriscalpium vulgare TaxID=40419 RepID=A0ACB8RZQ5_9AGAM|nr:hypothetical protein FA95DRAFT_1556986 [Auriscalpium vulgare]
MAATPTAVAYNFCSTRAEVISAIATLSLHAYAVLDCEGRELGTSQGALSLLCLGTPIVPDCPQVIYIIDIPAIRHDSGSVAALSTFLADPTIIKVVWDGRMDAIELYETLAADMGTVLDLQIAEIFGRPMIHAYPERKRLERLANSGFGYSVIRKRDALFESLDAVIGMQRCLEDLELDFGVRKDTEVVEMHRSGQSSRWMERPLSPTLLQYAAGDIIMIAHLFAHFCEKKYIQVAGGASVNTLLGSSHRYVYRHGKRGRIEKDGEFRPKALLVPSALYALPGPKATCEACQYILPLLCFQFDRRQRKSQHRCRVCEALVLKKELKREHYKGQKSIPKGKKR